MQELLSERSSLPAEEIMAAIRSLVNRGLFAAGRLDEGQGTTGHLVSIWLTGEGRSSAVRLKPEIDPRGSSRD